MLQEQEGIDIFEFNVNQVVMDYWFALLTGFLGSMHCIGMCGAIVLAYSSRPAAARPGISSMIPFHLVYNAGRVLSYGVAGGLLGMLGGGLHQLQSVGEYFSLAAGVLIVVFGFYSLKAFPGTSIRTTSAETEPRRNFLRWLYRNLFGRLISSPTLESKFYIGLGTPLLPCALLYGMFIKAASMANPASSALLMIMFGLGIVPALLVTGMASSFLSQRIRSYGEKLAALTMILMGIMLILRSNGVHLPMGGDHHHIH